VLTPAERSFLTARLEDLRESYETVQFALRPSAIHGDAHQSNHIRRRNGQILLIDFERFAFGLPECDLAVTATEYLIGWHTDAAYASFCGTYGFDVTKWEGFRSSVRSTNSK
jgi:aminoglycoside phosphotransferase (APT) family kinase protein